MLISSPSSSLLLFFAPYQFDNLIALLTSHLNNEVQQILVLYQLHLTILLRLRPLLGNEGDIDC